MGPPNGPGLFNPSRAARRAQALLSMGRPHAALDLLAGALRQAPDDAYLHRAMSRVFMYLDRYDDAIASARSAIKYAPDGWLMHTALALAYINAYRHADAVTPALTAVRLQPNVSYPFAWAGEALRGVGDLSGALENAQSASRMAPDRHQPLMARIFFSLGRWRESEEECERAYSRYPEDAYIACFHGLALIAQGRLDEASSLQRSVLRRQPSNLLSRFLLERLESWRPNTRPASLGQMVELEAELHRARIAILTAEAEDRERGAGAVLHRPMPPPLGR
jgi:tetratricopeptide (TPR) repeat protein